ncbi:pH-response regulator protein palC [Neurospora tetrasperma FGSC 2509]|nr:pH-response regulator protein palC [Neurospora tetrasperma FGSC 2509]
MPYPFVLPTTSSFSFTSCFSCESHPSLPLNASTRRGVVREDLKAFKRTPREHQVAKLPTVVSSLIAYLPYLFAVDAGLSQQAINGEEIAVILKTAPVIEWRPTLSDNAAVAVPGKDPARVKVHSLEYEVFFVLSCLANAHTLQARTALHPLYVLSTAPVDTQQRQVAVSAATKNLLDAASIYDYLALRAEGLSSGYGMAPPCADISPAALRAQCSLAMAEATLLAVLKDDPYPAVVAQDRNKNDTEWMYKAPDIPKVRAHLFARLCLAASEHAAQAYSLCAGLARSEGGAKVTESFLKYLDNLRRTSRAKACRFFGIDSELGGQTGTAIAWLNAGLQELGVERNPSEGGSKKSGGFGRLKEKWTEKREDKKVERGLDWGADAGRLEETRVYEMLWEKWSKQNDTIMTQVVPPSGPLLQQMPMGREIHTLKPFQPPQLDSPTLEAMRAPPERSDDAALYPSSDEDDTMIGATIGAFPGTQGHYRTGTPNYF